MKLRYTIFGAIAAAALQTHFAAGFIVERATLLKTGNEVVFKTGFVDPRDLFRGHYVRVNLEISRTVKADLDFIDPELKSGDPVYAQLIQAKDGFWVPVNLHAAPPSNSTTPIIKGEIRTLSTHENIFISFPIDRYFAPKAEAIRLENLRNERKLGLVVALDDQGQAGVKGITVDGEIIYDEPLF